MKWNAKRMIAPAWLRTQRNTNKLMTTIVTCFPKYPKRISLISKNDTASVKWSRRISLLTMKNIRVISEIYYNVFHSVRMKIYLGSLNSMRTKFMIKAWKTSDYSTYPKIRLNYWRYAAYLISSRMSRLKLNYSNKNLFSSWPSKSMVEKVNSRTCWWKWRRSMYKKSKLRRR